MQDSVAGTRLLDQVAAGHAAALGIDTEITARGHGATGFTPVPKRWAVARTYGWLMLHRRPARDYETLPNAPKP